MSIHYSTWAKGGIGPNFSVESPKDYVQSLKWVSHWFDIYFFNKVSDYLLLLGFFIILFLSLFKNNFKNKIKKNNFKKKFILVYILIVLVFLYWFFKFSNFTICWLFNSFLFNNFTIYLLYEWKIRDK